MKQSNHLPLLCGLLLVAGCMRAPISGVGPLVAQIAQDLSLSAGVSGMLTTIPLVIFALVCPLASKLSRVCSSRVQIAFCVICLASGTLVRSYLGLVGLFVGTALIGTGVGILNVVIPLFVKTNFAGKIGVVMACYTAMMTAVSSFSSGVVLGLSSTLGSWSHSLGVFALLPLLALPIWLFVSKQLEETVPSQQKEEGQPAPLGKVHVYTALFFGLQAFLFYGIIAWLPSILLLPVADETQVSLMMVVMQLASLLTNFAMPLAMQKGRGKGLGMWGGLTYLAGFVLVLLTLQYPIFAWPAVLLLGLAGGMSISFVLTFISMQQGSKQDTARLSAFSQCVGYLIAAPGPFLVGALTDWTGAFVLPIYIFIGVCLLFVWFGRQMTGVLAKC